MTKDTCSPINSVSSSSFTISVSGGVQVSAQGAQFMLLTSPIIAFYASQSGGSLALQSQLSRSMIRFSFSGPGARNYNSYCAQQTSNLAYWYCRIDYAGVPPTQSYMASLRATSPTNGSVSVLDIPVNPPRF